MLTLIRPTELEEELDVFWEEAFDPLHLIHSEDNCKVWYVTQTQNFMIVYSDNLYHVKKFSKNKGRFLGNPSIKSYTTVKDLIEDMSLSYLEPEFFEDDVISSLSAYNRDQLIWRH